MAMNIRLKLAFIEAGVTQQEIASETNIHFSRLSRIVRGWTPATDDEQKAIAKALRRQRADLFPDAVTA